MSGNEQQNSFSHRTSETTISNGRYVRQFFISKLGDASNVAKVEENFTECAAVSSPFIVGFQCYKEKPDFVSLSRLFVPGRSLRYLIEKYGALKLPLVLNTAAQIAIATEEMHVKSIPLKALLPQNVIILNDGHVKLVDVGIEAIKNDSIGISSSPAALLFLGPEGSNGTYNSSLQLDIWNFGVLIYLMMKGELPFVDPNLPKMMKSIIAGDFFIDQTVICDDRMRQLLLKMLVADPLSRATIKVVKDEIDSYRSAIKHAARALRTQPSFEGKRAPKTLIVDNQSEFCLMIKNNFVPMPKGRKVYSMPNGTNANKNSS